jgi:hypothetical protein
VPVPILESAAPIALAEWFAGEAVRVFTILHETAEERECRRLVEWIEAYPFCLFARIAWRE